MAQVCNTSFQYTAIDQLTVDLKNVYAAEYVGATVHHVQDDGTETLLGMLAECAATTTPCSRAVSVCLDPGSGLGQGKIRIWAQVPWTPVRRWNLFLRDDRRDSNRVNAEITRPDNLPYASAGIAMIRAQRSGNTSGSFEYQIWSPGIRDRRIFVTREVWSNGVRLSTSSTNFIETVPSLNGSSGGITIAAGETELIVTMEERTLDGVVLTTDRKTAIF